MNKLLVSHEGIENNIYLVRGQRVMFDSDLAMIYGVETKAFNRAIERNSDRFPEDFSFFLTQPEWEVLRCQFGTSKKGRGGRRYMPRVFTEHGAYAAAFVLRSERAQAMSIAVVRAFVHMRKNLATHERFGKELRELKSFVLKHSHKSNQEFKRLWNAITKLYQPPADNRRIGFDLT
jgi:hypothetical protein